MMAAVEGRRLIRIMIGGLLVAAMLLSGASAVSAQDDAATDQRVVRLVSDYEVQAELGRIDVVEEITVSNVRGNTRSGNTITSYFWTGHTVWLPDDAEGASISVDGNELEWEVVDSVEGYDVISADYRTNLNFGQTKVIDVTYSLPTYGPEAETGRRVNEAFFFFDMVICCGFEEVTLTLGAPSEYIITPPDTLKFDSTVSGDRQQFTFFDNEVTGQFTEIIFVDWFGFNEAGMDRSTADVGSASIELVFPPDDPAWATTTSADIAELGATLEELIGTPFPVQELAIQQGRNDDFDRWGFEGPYDEEPLTVPRGYDQLGVAATLSRAWLADGPFEQGTITDGLAFELASEAVTRNGGTVVAPGSPTSSSTLSNEGAHWVMRQVAEEIGHDGLTDIIRMANSDETAYTGSGDAEQVATIPADWRRFLDLAEVRLGSDTVGALFQENLLDDEGLAQFDERAAAIEDYEDFADSTEASVPIGIRTAMTNWEFGDAETMLATAREVVAERDRIIGDNEGRASDEGLALGEDWEQAQSIDDLEAVRTSLTERESELDQSALIRLILIVVGLLVLAAVLLGGFLLWRRRKGGSDGPQTGSQPVVDLTAGQNQHVSVAPTGPPVNTPPGGAPPAYAPQGPGQYAPVGAPQVAGSPPVAVPPVGVAPPSATPAQGAYAEDPMKWAPPVPGDSAQQGSAAPYTDATIQVPAPDAAPVVQPPTETPTPLPDAGWEPAIDLPDPSPDQEEPSDTADGEDIEAVVTDESIPSDQSEDSDPPEADQAEDAPDHGEDTDEEGDTDEDGDKDES